MPRAYSNDLRQRVIAACEAGTQPRREIAAQFQISEGTLYDWLRRFRAQGSYAPAPHAGGIPSRLDERVLRDLVRCLSRGLRRFPSAITEQPSLPRAG